MDEGYGLDVLLGKNLDGSTRRMLVWQPCCEANRYQVAIRGFVDVHGVSLAEALWMHCAVRLAAIDEGLPQ